MKAIKNISDNRTYISDERYFRNVCELVQTNVKIPKYVITYINDIGDSNNYEDLVY